MCYVPKGQWEKHEYNEEAESTILSDFAWQEKEKSRSYRQGDVPVQVCEGGHIFHYACIAAHYEHHRDLVDGVRSTSFYKKIFFSYVNSAAIKMGKCPLCKRKIYSHHFVEMKGLTGSTDENSVKLDKEQWEKAMQGRPISIRVEQRLSVVETTLAVIAIGVYFVYYVIRAAFTGERRDISDVFVLCTQKVGVLPRDVAPYLAPIFYLFYSPPAD